MADVVIVDLQTSYEQSADGRITVDSTVGTFTITDNATPIGEIFRVEDNNNGGILSVSPGQVDVGCHLSIISSATPEFVLEVVDGTNSIRWWPTDRTFTTAQGALMRLGGTYTLDYANVSFGGLNLQATIIHNQAGFPFNHGLLFNHGNTYYNVLNVAANFGPIQGFIDQPAVYVNRTSAGTITMGQLRSFLSQPRFGRQSTSGALTVTNVANFQGFGNVAVGATITTWTRVMLGPFTTPTTGTITNYYGIDIRNETQPSTIITGIRSQIASAGGGTRRNIEVTGTAISTFAGDVHVNNTVAVVLGTPAGSAVELSRPSAGVMRMIGSGGANDEGLDWDFQTTANVVSVSSSTGAALRIDNDIGFYGTAPVPQAAAIVLLTDSTGGTANNTLAAVSGSGDDATINDNFADLGAKVNAIIGVINTATGVGLTA